MSERARDLLRRAIYRAFKDVGRPSARSLIGHDCADCEEVMHDFTPYTQRNLPNTVLERHCASLPVFSALGLRYFLPCYLKYSLSNNRSEITERLLIHLTPPDTTSDYWRERLRVFSHQQRIVVCAFLDYLRAQERTNYELKLLQIGKSIWCAPKRKFNATVKGNEKAKATTAIPRRIVAKR